LRKLLSSRPPSNYSLAASEVRRRLGAQIYPSESLLAYLDFLPRAFLAHGLPLRLYVDCHSFFLSSVPDALTQLGAALHFYGVSFRSASSPQAKGKIERSHQDWQNRLPALCAAEAIHTIAPANALLANLCLHRDTHERHRELVYPAAFSAVYIPFGNRSFTLLDNTR
jgi:hypothetical protein